MFDDVVGVVLRDDEGAVREFCREVGVGSIWFMMTQPSASAGNAMSV